MAKTIQGLLPAALYSRPFKWSGEDIIQLDVKIQGHLAKAVYDAGCSGVGLSAAWEFRHNLGPSVHMPLTIFSSKGTLLSRSKYITSPKSIGKTAWSSCPPWYSQELYLISYWEWPGLLRPSSALTLIPRRCALNGTKTNTNS